MSPLLVTLLVVLLVTTGTARPSAFTTATARPAAYAREQGGMSDYRVAAQGREKLMRAVLQDIARQQGNEQASIEQLSFILGSLIPFVPDLVNYISDSVGR